MKSLFRRKKTGSEEGEVQRPTSSTVTGGGSSISPRTTGTSGTQAMGTRPTSAGRSGQSSSIPENTAMNESAQGVSERQTLADGTTAPATGHTGTTTTGTETSTGAGTGTGFGTGTGRSAAPAVTHTDSISQRYTPTELPSLDPRRDQMTKLVGSTTGLPPGPGGQIEELTASYDKKPWQIAQEKTRLAEQEASSASLAAEGANRSLREAQLAEKTVADAGSRHAQLLAEAERQKALLQDPSSKVASYKDAKASLAELQAEAERHNNALAALEAEVAAKKADFEKNQPLIEQHHKKVSRVTEEYDEQIRKQDAVQGDRDRLYALANEAEGTRANYTNEVDRLTQELMRADDYAAEKERDFINAKEARRVIAARLAEAKDKHVEAENAFMAHAKNADQAKNNLDGFVEKSSTLKKQLDEYEEEHTRMVNLERDREGEFNLALAKLEGLRAEGEPKRHALADAEAALNSRRAALEEAQNRARDAENRYKALMDEADVHAAKGSEAAAAAKKALADFENLRKEAQLHGDRHAQLWQEAMQSGTMGSESATSAFRALEQKISNFAS